MTDLALDSESSRALLLAKATACPVDSARVVEDWNRRRSCRFCKPVLVVAEVPSVAVVVVMVATTLRQVCASVTICAMASRVAVDARFKVDVSSVSGTTATDMGSSFPSLSSAL